MDLYRKTADAVETAIAQDQTPGAVVLIGRRDDILLHDAWGRRMVAPQQRPMQPDTVFDLASLTKPLATAPAIMQLAESGELLLTDPVSRFIPHFTEDGRDDVTILHLMTHASGLPAYRNYLDYFDEEVPADQRRDKAIADICSMPLNDPPGTNFVYSCLGYLLLASIIERVTGSPLDEYARKHIFEPLGMTDTCFNPDPQLRDRCAATEQLPDGVLVGVVHDETARFLNGVGGNAGLFGTAIDISRYMRAILNGGEFDGRRILSGASVALMTSPRSELPAGVRGLGWDLHSSYSPQLRGDLFPPGGFGHSGYTGTSIWGHHESGVYVVILTNRVHLGRDRDVSRLRRQVANVAAAALIHHPPIPTSNPARPVKSGLDVLAERAFDTLRGRRIGIVCNHTAVDNDRRHIFDLVKAADHVEIAALFGPEHGFNGTVAEGERVDSSTHETGIPVHSLYGAHQAPTPKMLADLDALVYDIADVGVRFYTYTTTMALCMRAAAKADIDFILLDRPNPINGLTVEGPVLDIPFDRLSAWHPIALRHGMTSGELALWSNDQYEIGCNLRVIQCDGWHRDMWFDNTGMPWLNPSPNIRNLKQAILYPAIGTLEATNLSVGRGTDAPFELFGAPWIDDRRLAHRLNALQIPQLTFTPIEFTPDASKFIDLTCRGVYIMLHDRRRFQAVPAAVKMAHLLRQMWPDVFEYQKLHHLLGSKTAVQMIGDLAPVDEIIASWSEETQQFEQMRQPYLLYE